MLRACAVVLLALAWAVCGGVKPSLAQDYTLCVSQLNDLSATVAPGSGDLELADSSILVEKRRDRPGVGNSSYQVTAQGSAGGGFNLLGPGGALLPYSVFWTNSAGVGSSSGASQLTHNTASPFDSALQMTQGQTLNSCGDSGGAANASLILRFGSAALNAAANGVYSGTLTLLIGP